MRLKYTLDDYIANPSGKGSSVIQNRNSLKQTYQTELSSLESRMGKITQEIYKGGGNSASTYSIRFKVPSNSTKGFYNDVVFEFIHNNGDSSNERTIRKYYIKFFSNDPNFIYTYAYTYKTHGVLIPELEKKLPFRSITQKPTTRNPDNAMGYNKDIFFCYLVMEREGLFYKDNLNRVAKSGGISALAAKIDSYSKKENERNKIISDLKQKEGSTDKDRPISKIIKNKSLNLLSDNPIVKFTNTVKSSKTIGNVKRIKRSKKI